MKTCPDCIGDGVIEKGTDDEQQCPTCGGSGFVPDDDGDEEVTRTVSLPWQESYNAAKVAHAGRDLEHAYDAPDL